MYFFQDQVVVEIVTCKQQRPIRSKSLANLERRICDQLSLLLLNAQEDNKATRSVCLDMHGVADLFETTAILGKSTDLVWILSFIGKNSERREALRKELEARIEAKQIQFGIMVFVRGSTPCVGTKAWILKLITRVSPLPLLFLDDGQDHIHAAEKLNIARLTCKYIQNKTEILPCITQMPKKIL